MSDIDAELAGFDRMLGIEPGEMEAAEPEAPAVVEEAPEPAAEVPAQAEQEAEAAQERQRDEKGRFAKEEEAEGELILGKYKSQEELVRAHEELQARLGQQGSELGTERSERERLAQVLEKLDARLDEPEHEEQAPVQVDEEWFEEQLAENPAGLANWAMNNAPNQLGRVLRFWKDDDPFAAAQFVFDARFKAMEASHEKRLAEALKPVQSVTQRTVLEQTLVDAGVKSEHSAFIEAAKFAPGVAEGLKSQDPQERVKAAQTLDYLAQGMSGLQQQTPAPPDPAAQTEAEQPDAAQVALDAKLDGSVATQTQSGDAEQVNEGDQWLEDIGFDAILDRYSPVD